MQLFEQSFKANYDYEIKSFFALELDFEYEREYKELYGKFLKIKGFE